MSPYPLPSIESLESRRLLSAASISGSVISGLDQVGLGGRTVFIDANQDGQLDDGEISTTTDASGNYVFNNLAAGVYRISQVLPAGATSADPGSGFRDVTVTTGQALAGVSFADLPAEVSNGPVLDPGFVKDLPASVIGGAKGTATIKITNGGSATASGPETLTLLASTAANFSVNNVVVTTVPLGTLTLKPNAAKTVTIKFNYPTSLPAGSYSMLVIPDSSNSVPQSGFNNAISSPVDIAPPFTQLAGGLPGRPPRALEAGKKASVAVEASNSGNESFTAPLTISLYESPDGLLDGGDVLLGSVIIPHSRLKAGGHATYHVAFRTPSNVVSGNEFLDAVVNGAAPAASSSTVAFSAG